MPESPRTLLDLAARCGVERGYHAADGTWQEAGAEALVRVLAACGVPIDSPEGAEEAARALDRRQAAEPLDPVGVAWQGRGGRLAVRLTASQLDAGALSVDLQCEDGSTRTIDAPVRAPAGPPLAEGSFPVHPAELLLPADLPLGRHRLVVRLEGRERTACVISAPTRAPQADGRGWGVFAPLYALRVENGTGIGDYGGLARLLALVSRLGGRFVGSTPLLAMFVGAPCVPSPYAPISRLFWNELLIDPQRTPEWPECPEARALWEAPAAREQRARLGAVDEIDYRAVRALI